MDTQSLLESLGYIGIFVSVFIECGFILGLILPLPGFSLLFTASVFAANNKMDLSTIIVVGITAAILGYISGYLTGRRYGRKLFFERSTKKYFTPKQGEQTERFMKKYGYSTLIIGRFLPVMHSLAPLLSGVAKTPFAQFMLVNVIGAVAWTLTACMSGYYLGQSVPHAQYLAIPFMVLLTFFINSHRGRSLMRDIGRWFEQI